MRISKGNIIAVLCLVVLPTVFLYSEGTKQLMPTTASAGQLCINKFRNDFGFYDAALPEFRLNISVSDPSESIRFGFGRVLNNDDNLVSDLVYRIKDQAGNVVKAQSSVPASGTGFISSYASAVTGPFTGGYNYLEFKPLTSGDYYIEFYYPAASGVYYDNNRRYLEFFDITVVNAAGNAVPGRVWSKAWQFWDGDGRFYAKMMILSDDSIVTQVNCNGLRGGSFSFSSNQTGCSTTGIVTTDRMSRSAFHTYPQYKIFLNNPDSNLFPTQTVTSGIIQPITPDPNCATGGADFGVKVHKDGTIRLLIQVNPSPAIDPEDVQLIIDAKANPPGASGENIITWDGNDNYGRPLSNGTNLTFSVTNLSGMTHLPIYDIEDNDYGFIVNQVRPAGGQLRIYWDDALIGGNSNASTGCISSSGCHTWNTGNNNTINSWWFVTSTEFIGINFKTEKIPGIPVISGNNVHCTGTTGDLEFNVSEPNSTNFIWSYSGTGVTIDASGLKATLRFAENATAGTLSVKGHNENCGDGPARSTEILFEALPVVSLEPFPDLCYTAAGFELTGGEPQGGTYFVNGAEADSIFPYKEPEGLLPVEYKYTSPTGCPNSVNSGILLTSGAECLGTIYFPTAFTPDGDSLNDQFRPVLRNISSFKMYVFSRWGQLVYSTDDAAKGWDGTFDGEDCPEGTYTYTATYGLSRRDDNMETKRGVFGLIR